ncbi:MAG: HNH endonuclease [Deltaproteobacteria bacterium]|nr:HNH endonuclease [Deltaproteobacteria bacterium]
MLDGGVLVLNRNFQPVHVTSVRRAVSLLYTGAAKAVDESFQTFDFESWAALGAELGDDDVIHSISRAFKVPRVIVLQVFDRFPRSRVRFSRQNIYLRDGLTCQYCGRRHARSGLNLDHVIPRSKGGRTAWENVVCCCIPCNVRKGGRTPEEAGMRLLKTPVRPRWSPFTRDLDGRRAHEAWRPFLNLVDASYWNTELIED